MEPKFVGNIQKPNAKPEGTFEISTKNIDIHPAPVYVQDNFPALTHREYFALAALQGLLASKGSNISPEDASKLSVNHAEALVKALGIED